MYKDKHIDSLTNVVVTKVSERVEQQSSLLELNDILSSLLLLHVGFIRFSMWFYTLSNNIALRMVVR